MDGPSRFNLASQSAFGEGEMQDDLVHWSKARSAIN